MKLVMIVWSSFATLVQLAGLAFPAAPVRQVSPVGDRLELVLSRNRGSPTSSVSVFTDGSSSMLRGSRVMSGPDTSAVTSVPSRSKRKGDDVRVLLGGEQLPAQLSTAAQIGAPLAFAGRQGPRAGG
jgi:hypothetical protein